MKKNKLQDLYIRLGSMTMLSGFTLTRVGEALEDLLEEIIYTDFDTDGYDLTQLYSILASEIFFDGGDLGLIVKDYIQSGDNLYIDKYLEGDITDEMEIALMEDIKTLQTVANLKSKDIIQEIESFFEDDVLFSDIPFAIWKNSRVRVEREFENLIKSLDTKGYGIFHDCIMFKASEHGLIPVYNADFQGLNELYGYDDERNKVLKNTENFANGEKASNVLLYGDAGTGKSTTVKACAGHYAAKGIRLIEFAKNQVSLIPEIAEEIAVSPLKFIFFIDDLSFEDNDDNYYALKGILEGNVSGRNPNVLVYATSNRRHLVRENMKDREGTDVHLNDTLQEIMSLSARFGLTVTFSKPNKDLYLELIEKLALEEGLLNEFKPGTEEYCRELSSLIERGEAYAIRANGRSPRAAKQFVLLAKNGLA